MGDGCSLNFVVSRTCCLQGADIFGADVYGWFVVPVASTEDERFEADGSCGVLPDKPHFCDGQCVSRVCLCGLWLGSFGQQVWRTLQSQSKATEGNKSCHWEAVHVFGTTVARPWTHLGRRQGLHPIFICHCWCRCWFWLDILADLLQPWWATGVRGARNSNLGEHRGWHWSSSWIHRGSHGCIMMHRCIPNLPATPGPFLNAVATPIKIEKDHFFIYDYRL